MAKTFGGAVKLQGESEYKKALSDITNNLKVMASEMKIVTSEYGRNTNSVDGLNQKNKVLNKEIDEQKSKINILKTALSDAKKETGENSTTTQKWQTELNNAQAKLISLEKEVESNENAMKDSTKATDDNTGAVKDLGNAVDSSSQKTSVFGDVLKANLASEAIIGGIKSIVNGIKSIASSVSDLVITGGMDRALGIENASFKLKGLGHDAEAVDAIMDNALASVKGTAFGLNEAATVAASAVAAGVEPGKELERTLSLVADASAISGRSMEDMGSIFNKVAANGKLTGQELNQLSDSGIPVLQLLGDSLGKSTEQIRSMVSAGKIGFNELQDAIELGMGGAAQTMGQTWEGAVDNTKAAASRLGASFMGPLTKELTPALGIITDLIDEIASGSVENIEGKVQELGSIVSSAISNLVSNIGPIIRALIPVLTSVLTEIVKMLPSIFTLLLDVFSELLPVVMDALLGLVDALLQNLPTILQALINLALELVTGLAEALPDMIPTIIKAVLELIPMLLKNLPLLIDAGIQLLMGLIDGIIDAIPILIEMAPEIIMQTISALIQALPKLMSVGPQLIIKLVGGIINAIPTLVANIPKIITAAVVGLMDGLSKITGVGKNLVEGLWKGINDAKDWILNKIKGFGDAILKGIKGFFGIKSPSTLFRDEVGKNLALGVGEGFTSEMDHVTAEMQKSLPTSFDVGINPNTSIGSLSDQGTYSSGGFGSESYQVVINNNSKFTTPAETARLARRELQIMKLRNGG